MIPPQYQYPLSSAAATRLSRTRELRSSLFFSSYYWDFVPTARKWLLLTPAEHQSAEGHEAEWVNDYDLVFRPCSARTGAVLVYHVPSLAQKLIISQGLTILQRRTSASSSFFLAISYSSPCSSPKAVWPPRVIEQSPFGSDPPPDIHLVPSEAPTSRPQSILVLRTKQRPSATSPQVVQKILSTRSPLLMPHSHFSANPHPSFSDTFYPLRTLWATYTSTHQSTRTLTQQEQRL